MWMNICAFTLRVRAREWFKIEPENGLCEIGNTQQQQQQQLISPAPIPIPISFLFLLFFLFFQFLRLFLSVPQYVLLSFVAVVVAAVFIFHFHCLWNLAWPRSRMHVSSVAQFCSISTFWPHSFCVRLFVFKFCSMFTTSNISCPEIILSNRFPLNCMFLNSELLWFVWSSSPLLFFIHWCYFGCLHVCMCGAWTYRHFFVRLSLSHSLSCRHKSVRWSWFFKCD